MIWECRRLTREQVRDLDRLGQELRHRFASDIAKDLHGQARS